MVLGACMPASNDDVTTRQNSSVDSDFATKPFSASPSRKVTASNKDIERDFMDLSFSLESGRNLPVFTRFEGPSSVRLTGKVPQSLTSELNRLIHRLGFSYFAMGRIVQRANRDEALRMFKAADKIFRQSTQTNLYAAHTAVQLASYQIAYGKGQEAFVTLAPYLDAAYEEENAALLSTLIFLRAGALELTGRASEARIVRLDSLNWARYGFGSEKHLKTKLREIQALNPLNRRNG
jgi:hypothetical protein